MFWSDFLWKEARAKTEDYQKSFFKRVGHLSCDKKWLQSFIHFNDPINSNNFLVKATWFLQSQVLVCIQYQQMYRIILTLRPLQYRYGSTGYWNILLTTVSVSTGKLSAMVCTPLCTMLTAQPTPRILSCSDLVSFDKHIVSSFPSRSSEVRIAIVPTKRNNFISQMELLQNIHYTFQ
jgi:hypothetical protein